MPSRYGHAEFDPSISKFSIIIPTNLSDPLIIDLLNSIRKAVPKNYRTEIVLIENSQKTNDQNSLLEERKKAVIAEILDFQNCLLSSKNFIVKLVRSGKSKGKTVALLDGIKTVAVGRAMAKTRLAKANRNRIKGKCLRSQDCCLAASRTRDKLE